MQLKTGKIINRFHLGKTAMSTYNANRLYMINCKTLIMSKFNISDVGPFENKVKFYRIMKSTMNLHIK